MYAFHCFQRTENIYAISDIRWDWRDLNSFAVEQFELFKVLVVQLEVFGRILIGIYSALSMELRENTAILI